MGKLSELMAEATKNITKTTRPVNIDHVFTGITKETNLKVISTYVTSKDRFERIGIAANPALTVAQQEILSNDKLDSIKQALCYNFNLDTNIAVKLLDEDVGRVETISKYGNPKLHNIVFKYVEKLNKNQREGCISNVLGSSEIDENTLVYAIKNYPEAIFYPPAIKLSRIHISDKITKIILDHAIKTNTPLANAFLKDMLSSKVNNISETDIKRMDWKNSYIIQSGIFEREGLSDEFYLQVIDNYKRVTTVSAENKSLKKSKILNAFMSKFISLKGEAAKWVSWQAFENTQHIPLDPKLLVSMVKYLEMVDQKNGQEAFISNVSYPHNSLDNITMGYENIGVFLKYADNKRCVEEIDKFMVDTRSADAVKYAIGSIRTPFDLPDNTLMRMLDLVKNGLTGPVAWFEYVIHGKKIDEILKNIDDYTSYFDLQSSRSHLKAAVLYSLAANRFLTPKQAKNVLSAYKQLKPDETPTYKHLDIETTIAVSGLNPDKEYLKKQISSGNLDPWIFWNTAKTNVRYYEFSKEMIEFIDAEALNTKIVKSDALNTETFDKWVEYSNGFDQGFDKTMDTEKALKFLKKFLTDGDDKLITKLTSKGFLSDVWLKTEEIQWLMYHKTKDKKYLPELVKDVFFVI